MYGAAPHFRRRNSKVVRQHAKRRTDLQLTPSHALDTKSPDIADHLHHFPPLGTGSPVDFLRPDGSGVDAACAIGEREHNEREPGARGFFGAIADQKFVLDPVTYRGFAKIK